MTISPRYILCAQNTCIDRESGLVSLMGVLDSVRIEVPAPPADEPRPALIMFPCHIVAAWWRDDGLAEESPPCDYDFAAQIDGREDQVVNRGTFRFKAGVRMQRIRVSQPEIFVPLGTGSLTIVNRLRADHIGEIAQSFTIRIELIMKGQQA